MSPRGLRHLREMKTSTNDENHWPSRHPPIFLEYHLNGKVVQIITQIRKVMQRKREVSVKDEGKNKRKGKLRERYRNAKGK